MVGVSQTCESPLGPTRRDSRIVAPRRPGTGPPRFARRRGPARPAPGAPAAIRARRRATRAQACAAMAAQAVLLRAQVGVRGRERRDPPAQRRHRPVERVDHVRLAPAGRAQPSKLRAPTATRRRRRCAPGRRAFSSTGMGNPYPSGPGPLDHPQEVSSAARRITLGASHTNTARPGAICVIARLPFNQPPCSPSPRSTRVSALKKTAPPTQRASRVCHPRAGQTSPIAARETFASARRRRSWQSGHPSRSSMGPRGRPGCLPVAGGFSRVERDALRWWLRAVGDPAAHGVPGPHARSRFEGMIRDATRSTGDRVHERQPAGPGRHVRGLHPRADRPPRPSRTPVCRTGLVIVCGHPSLTCAERGLLWTAEGVVLKSVSATGSTTRLPGFNNLRR